MIYEYIRDYFIDSKSDKSKSSQIYLMDCIGTKFLFIDYSNLYPLNLMEIQYEKKMAENSTLMFRIKDITKYN